MLDDMDVPEPFPSDSDDQKEMQEIQHSQDSDVVLLSQRFISQEESVLASQVMKKEHYKYKDDFFHHE